MDVAVVFVHVPEGDGVVAWVLFGLSALIPLLVVVSPLIVTARSARSARRRRADRRSRRVEIPGSHIGRPEP